MKKSLLLGLVGLLLAGLLLVACGQTGPLYLPAADGRATANHGSF